MFTVVKLKENTIEDIPEEFSRLDSFKLNDKKIKPILIEIERENDVNQEELENPLWLKSKIILTGLD